jgi:hypothetical protein
MLVPKLPFFIETSSPSSAGREHHIHRIVGALTLSEHQAEHLQLNNHSRCSLYLEKCCLLMSTNEAYARATEDIKALIGVGVSHGTQQHIAHRHTFPCLSVDSFVFRAER